MGRWRRSTACERTAQWSSLELDGELGEVERAALYRHLEHCADCAATRAEVEGFTRLLRQAPPVRAGTPVDISLRPLRRAHRVRRAAASLAFTAALGAALGGLALSQGRGSAASSALRFGTSQEHLRFVRAEQARGEPLELVVAAGAAKPLSFASRVLG